MQRYRVDGAVEDRNEGGLSRRDTLRLLTGLTGAALSGRILDAQAQDAPGPTVSAPAAPTTPAATPAPAHAIPPARSAASVKYNDPEVVAATMQFAGVDLPLMAYIARPAKAGAFPVVLVCHDNLGLTRHIEDVVRRLAKAGYVGFAVDLLSREGGTQKHGADAVSTMLGKVPTARHVQDFQSALMYVKGQPYARGDRVGMIGFSFGGGIAWRVAVAMPELKAVVPFYGLPVAATDVPKVQAAVLAIYAGRDERINANTPAIESAMNRRAKVFRKIVYPDVDHAFHNDTGDRFSAGAALAAWDETLAWLAKYLRDA